MLYTRTFGYRTTRHQEAHTHLVRRSIGDAWHRSVVSHVVQLVRRDEAVVFDSPHRRLDVEGVAPGKAHQLGVAGDPVIRRPLLMSKGESTSDTARGKVCKTSF